MKVEDLMKQQGKELKDTKKSKPTKAFKNLSTNEKWELVEALLRGLKYID